MRRIDSVSDKEAGTPAGHMPAKRLIVETLRHRGQVSRRAATRGAAAAFEPARWCIPPRETADFGPAALISAASGTSEFDPDAAHACAQEIPTVPPLGAVGNWPVLPAEMMPAAVRNLLGGPTT